MLKGKFSKYKHKLNMIKDYINYTSKLSIKLSVGRGQKQKQQKKKIKEKRKF